MNITTEQKTKLNASSIMFTFALVVGGMIYNVAVVQTSVSQTLKALQKQGADQESRIRSLEKNNSQLEVLSYKIDRLRTSVDRMGQRLNHQPFDGTSNAARQGD